MSDIDIKGLDKGAVLAALYNAARAVGFGLLQDIGAAAMTAEDGAAALGSPCRYIDYLKGRPLKVDLSGDSFDPRLYDRDQGGTGAAARAVAPLRSGA